MPAIEEGPAAELFASVTLRGNTAFDILAGAGVSEQMARAAAQAPTGRCALWGLPFRVGRPVLLRDRAVRVSTKGLKAQWLVFMHTSDMRPSEWNADGFIPSSKGYGKLGEHAADYVIVYENGDEARVPVRRRHEVGAFWRPWGENCFEAVPHRSAQPAPAEPDDTNPNSAWGHLQYRLTWPDLGQWMNWLWAWENPHPGRAIAAIRFEPVSGALLVSGLSAGRASAHPLRWRSRRKAVVTLPKGEAFNPHVDEVGQFPQIRLDMGRVIAARPRPLYPDDAWERSYNNKLPELSGREVLVEYTSHPDACFHLSHGATVPVARLEEKGKARSVRVCAPATRGVTLKVVEKGSGRPVAVKLHVHGAEGEYLAPVERHRVPNSMWFQDYSVDFAHNGIHWCSYVPGETRIDLPLGPVYVEVSKGFEIRPVRRRVKVSRRTEEITIELEKVLPWRERGWVSADTHVHFLSTQSALIEGAGEGVNVVNLLASQWGELLTNVGDFDGRTTLGSKEAGGDGEYLVRVGTENRQHVLGHISLLGYNGNIIAPMTTGGPTESAMGDPVECLLTEWARQCKAQDGVVVIPHFPNPRAENAATIVSGGADAVEMTSWGNLYGGIDPYSLSDWYRYLNCGYMVAAVGGTDKMSSGTAVGTVRTYAHIDPAEAFDYDAWKRAVRAGRTFATYGPLMEFSVDGHNVGSRFAMTRSGGTVDVQWQVASVTVPMSRVDLIVNGEVRESRGVRPDEDAGHWSVGLDRSSWLALLVRGGYADKREIIAAHSTPVMVDVEGSQFSAAADAATILEQIEGALAYLDTVGTRAETTARRRMRMLLTSVHRELHNRMHQMGQYHDHTPADAHEDGHS
jgi:hypothetical protein